MKKPAGSHAGALAALPSLETSGTKQPIWGGEKVGAEAPRPLFSAQRGRRKAGKEHQQGRFSRLLALCHTARPAGCLPPAPQSITITQPSQTHTPALGIFAALAWWT